MWDDELDFDNEDHLALIMATASSKNEYYGWHKNHQEERLEEEWTKEVEDKLDSSEGGDRQRARRDHVPATELSRSCDPHAPRAHLASRPEEAAAPRQVYLASSPTREDPPPRK